MYILSAYLMLLTVFLVDFSLVQCVAVLNVFVGVEAFCLAVSHHGHSW
jgi:hypothetical protein